jgi:hypothetical protein
VILRVAKWGLLHRNFVNQMHDQLHNSSILYNHFCGLKSMSQHITSTKHNRSFLLTADSNVQENMEYASIDMMANKHTPTIMWGGYEHHALWSLSGAVIPIQKTIWTHQYRKIYCHPTMYYLTIKRLKNNTFAKNNYTTRNQQGIQKTYNSS